MNRKAECRVVLDTGLLVAAASWKWLTCSSEAALSTCGALYTLLDSWAGLHVGAVFKFTTEKESAMRSLGLSLALVVTPLLVGSTPSEAMAQQARPVMALPRPMMTPFLPG